MAESDRYAAEKAHLKEHGWARMRSVLSKDEAAQALEKLWEAKAKVEAGGEETFLPFLDPNPSNIRIFYLLQLDQIFRDLIFHPTALEMVGSVLGEKFIISNFTANIARPGSKSMCLHSDQSLVMPDPWTNIWAMNAVWCLTDVTKENGATLYIPGSNKIEARTEVPSNAPELLVPFEAEAGDVLIMDGRLWHTSGENVTKDQDRALLFGYYTAPHIRQQTNWAAALSKEIQEGFSPAQRTMLGLDPTANVDVVGDLRFLSVQFPGLVPS
ncbi:putative phytanoyl-CoA dioxygenase [Camillea tinctor]|nr:putative phytanoyl-CoA dioxygenase [Camillea tinctor]